METKHNDGPEHWCGECRIDPHHRARKTQLLEKLFVRCVAAKVIFNSGFDYLMGVLHGK